MIANLEAMLRKIETWPPEDQEALAEAARDIEAERTGVYVASEAELRAIDEGLAQADRGEFASDAQIAAIRKRFAAS